MTTSGHPAPRSDHCTWRTVLAGSLLFLNVGLFLILNEIPITWPAPDWFLFVQTGVLVLLLVTPAVGASLGWVQGLPRWSYPYVGNLLLFSLYMMQVATPGLRLFGYTFGRSDLWGWRAWLPALVMLALALLVSRSLWPAASLVAGIGRDWTLWTWCLFGFLPFLVGIGFDEMDRLFSLPYMGLVTLVAVGTALVYLCNSRRWLRVLALVGGTGMLVAIGVGVPAYYWQQHSGINILGAVKAGAILLAVLFAPAALALIRRSPQALHPA